MMTSAVDQTNGDLELQGFGAAMPEIRIGKRYRIVSGGMKGVEGVASRTTAQGHVLLEVRILGQNALLEIHPERLESAAAEMPAWSGS